MSYDADAMEALDDGHVPSCHAIVGTQSIFHDDIPGPDTICVGHELWAADVPGYEKPPLGEWV